MRRSLASALVLLAAAAAPTLPGCTLWPGRGWGEADVTLAARFAPDDSRLTDEGYLKTSRDYAIAFEVMQVDVEAVELVVTDADENTELSFDPASPPPGYSLCHAGHCHADDGRLVDYAEIEAELTGAVASAYSAVLTATEAVPLSTAGEPVPLADCTGDCVLPRGVLERAGVRLASLSLSGAVFDLRTGDQVRLPPEGVPFSGTIAIDDTIAASVGAPLDGSEPPGVGLDLVLDVTPSLFDGVGLAFFVEESFLDLNIPPGFVENDIAGNVVEASAVTATVERYEVELATGPVLFPQGGNNTQGGS